MLIKNLPFYWRLKETKSSHGSLPQNFDFTFESEEPGLLIQGRSPQLLEYLEQVYREDYNIGYIQEQNTLARPYYIDLRDSIVSLLNANPYLHSVLEVGCGGALILRDLKQLGYSVTGVDPSPLSKRVSEQFGIKVVNTFFTSKTFTEEKFDLIFHSDVLEHVSSPVDFLRDQFEVVEEGGGVFVAVPDATESINLGDISMAMHQHLNHFDEVSLANCFRMAGFVEIKIQKAGYGGSLYGFGRKKTGASEKLVENKSLKNFFLNVHEKTKKVEMELQLMPQGSGLYVPNRGFPYLFSAFKKPDFRIFDDTPHWHKRYFDGYDRPVENMDDFFSSPPEAVFIASLTFGNVIKQKILGRGYKGKVVLLKEVLGS